MEIRQVCASYFKGIQELSNYKNNDNSQNLLALAKFVSYFTVIIPLAVGIVYACASLCGRVTSLSPFQIQTPPALPAALGVSIQARLNAARLDKATKRTIDEVWQEDISRFTHGDMINYFQALARQYPTFAAPAGMYIYEVPADGKIIPGEHRDINSQKQKIANVIVRDMLQCQIKEDKKIFAYPVLISKDHWTLVVVDREKRCIEYYNSFGAVETDLQTVRYIEQIKPLLNKYDAKGKNYTFSEPMKQKMQSNTSQCGPWTLFLLQLRLENPRFDFSTLQPSLGLENCLRTFRADARAAIDAA